MQDRKHVLKEGGMASSDEGTGFVCGWFGFKFNCDLRMDFSSLSCVPWYVWPNQMLPSTTMGSKPYFYINKRRGCNRVSRSGKYPLHTRGSRLRSCAKVSRTIWYHKKPMNWRRQLTWSEFLIHELANLTTKRRVKNNFLIDFEQLRVSLEETGNVGHPKDLIKLGNDINLGNQRPNQALKSSAPCIQLATCRSISTFCAAFPKLTR